MVSSPPVSALVDTSSWTSADWVGLGLGVVGLLVSIGGFWIAIRQIQKTRTAANAAATAANQTARALVQNHLLYLIPELARVVAEAETAVANGQPQRAAELLSAWRSGATRARGLLRARGGLSRDLASAFTGAFSTVTDAKVLLRQPGANAVTATEPAFRALDNVMDEIGDLGGQLLGDPQGD